MERALQVRARERPYQQTYAILRQRVITHAFSPDQPLKCRELADELQVSATPVRDVLLTLSAEGLIARSPAGGFSMPVPSPIELADLYEAAACLTSGFLKLKRCGRQLGAAGPNGAARPAGRPDILSRLGRTRPDAPAFAETYVAATERLLEDVAALSGNKVIIGALRQVAARLHFARLLEPAFLDDTVSELVALDAARRGNRLRELAKGLDRFHKRRARIVGEIFKEAVTRRFSA